MKITEKIVTSVTPPQLINVAWHNPETGELKMFGNKGWEVVGGAVSDIPNDDSLTEEKLGWINSPKGIASKYCEQLVVFSFEYIVMGGWEILAHTCNVDYYNIGDTVSLIHSKTNEKIDTIITDKRKVTTEEGTTYTIYQFKDVRPDYENPYGHNVDFYVEPLFSNNTTSGLGAVACGYTTQALNKGSFSEGINTLSDGEGAHAEGYSTEATGNYSHAEGKDTVASGVNSHTEGLETIASGSYAHAEGWKTTAQGKATHVEGYLCSTNKNYAHAEGENSSAQGQGSHTEGKDTVTTGYYAHAEGTSTKAVGNASHSEGKGTIAQKDYQHVLGTYNEIDADNQYQFIIGNGANENNRSNAFAVKWDGTIVMWDDTHTPIELTAVILKNLVNSNSTSSTDPKYEFRYTASEKIPEACAYNFKQENGATNTVKSHSFENNLGCITFINPITGIKCDLLFSTDFPTNITTITLPDTVTEIRGLEVFTGAIEKVEYLGTKELWNSISKDWGWYGYLDNTNSDNTLVISCIDGTIILPDLLPA